MNKWIIYDHIFPNGKHYIGKTQQLPQDRWGNNGIRYKKQTLLWRAIQKYGWNNIKHEILFTNLTAEEANSKERECIQKYHSYYKDSEGPGYNLSYGGEGFSTISNEKRNDIIQQWYDGKTIQEIRESNDIGKETIKKIFNQAKISVNERVQRGIVAYKSNIIYQYDLNGNYINEYPSANEAQRQTNIPQGNICACLRGERRTAGNFQWLRERKEKILPALIGPGHYKTVYQYDLNYNLLNIYPSAENAAKITDHDASRIRTVAKKQGKAYDSIWSYEEIVK